MMIVRGVNVFPTQIEELLLGVPGLSAHYQLILTREGRLDKWRFGSRPGRRTNRTRRARMRRRSSRRDEGAYRH